MRHACRAHGRRLRTGAAIVALSLVAREMRAQQSCVLGDAAAPVNTPAGAAALALHVSGVKGGDGFTADVPFQERAVPDCVLHLSPRPGLLRFQLAVAATAVLPANATTVLHAQLVSLDSAHLSIASTVLDVGASGAGKLEVVIKPLAPRRAAEYNVAIAVTVEQKTNAAAGPPPAPPAQPPAAPLVVLPLKLLWAPPPVITLTTSRTSCGAQLCLTRDESEAVTLVGPDVAEVDVGRPAPTKADAANLGFPCCDLHAGAAGPFFLAKIGQEGAPTVTTTVSLLVARIPSVGAQPTTDYVLPGLAARVGPPATLRARFFSVAGTGDAPLPPIRIGAEPIDVRLEIQGGRAATRDAASQGEALAEKLESARSVNLRERLLGPASAVVAAFEVRRRRGATLWGRLVPIAATRPGALRNASPELAFEGVPDVVAQFTVLPGLSIKQHVVQRSGWPDQANGAVFPGEPARLLLQGPGVAHLTSGSFHGQNNVSFEPFGVRDSVIATFTVPLDAPATTPLRVRDVSGVEFPYDVTVAPNQRPRSALDYVQLEVRRRGRRAVLPLKPGDPTRLDVSSLSNVVMRFHPEQIDARDNLYGVQYLHVDAELTGPDGKSVAKSSKCIAVFPEELTAVHYALDNVGGCDRLTTDELSVSELIEPARRATAKTILDVRVHLEPTHYKYAQVGREAVLTLTRSGSWIVEPLVDLPGAVIAFRRGRVTPGVAYTGTALNIIPVGRDYLPNGPQTLALQIGAVMAQVASGSTTTSGGLDARLSALAGVSYVFRNIANTITMDLFVGRVWPVTGRGIVSRDAYWAIRPGAKLSLGGKS
jgi:hypothetical protein